ncbi:helix-hairpin-helix domain-containing protein [Halorubrum vacuolatum]|uniref:Helix-hairpin-helix domain-containing protein n=1 Tax=Halorubrum vacuolatum TaxID=63740 RepID=A0A238UUD8_HALVU|nr:helix-hairpin-helix domain-containing protein [Halorubrum vacuolatum]SNR25658.1 Helix-hairpin-helix domain-containing protein [Halorubrum vacuolatum]
MSLLKKIKGMLGMGDDADGGSGTSVTVEREAPVDDADEDEPAAAGTDAAASTGSLVEEPDVPEETAEPAEAVDAVGDATTENEPEGDDETNGVADTEAEETEAAVDTEGEETEATVDTEGDGAEDTDEASEDVDGEPVDSIRGIGPAYAERLGEIGIHTVSDLAEADPEAVAEGASVGEKRATTWIDRAKKF